MLFRELKKTFKRDENTPIGSKYTVILLWSKITKIVWLCVYADISGTLKPV